MSQWVYLNGRLIPEKQAQVSILSCGFLYGQGLFETMRSYHKSVFALDRHINRILTSARRINLRPRVSFSALKKAVLITLEKSNLADAYVRLNLWQDVRGINLACFLSRLKKLALQKL